MYAESKKLGNWVQDLIKIKKELKPKDDEEIAREEELKNLDKFQRKKHELNTLLRTIREDGNKLQDIKRRQGDKRDAETMKLYNDNQKALSNAKTMWDELKHLLADDAKKRAAKLGEKELNDRQKQLRLFGDEIVNLLGVFGRVKGAGPTSIDEVQGARTNDRAQKRREEKQQRKDKRKERRGRQKGGGFAELDEDAFQDAAPMSAQEQKFMDQVAANQQKENEMLDDISKGLDELKEMSLDIQKQLHVQKAIIDEVDNEMDNTIQALKSANSKMKDILETNGGMSRWCPILCCCCLLLAILAYVFNFAG